MVFSSIPFLFFFLPVFLIIYHFTPSRFKNTVILFFSLLFYSWGEPVYVFLMIFESFSDYLIGLRLEKAVKPATRKILLVCSVVIDLSILGFFKYIDFLIDSINSVFSLNINNLNLALPIGISFFTFQSMSYIIDLYKKEVEAEHSYLNYLTYISMFPQLIAGPIVRFASIRKELHLNRGTDRFFSESFVSGYTRFLMGLFKKVLIANRIGALFTEIDSLSASTRSVATVWLGAIAFTFQIYFDFSGYSDMAIGLGKIMGFTFEENFNHPLFSSSITDFWRKWHISLSTWFKNYVYIPLGGNRACRLKQIRNIMIVWMLTGLWHGASWNFVIWGLYFGIILILEKEFIIKILDKLPGWIRYIYSFILVCIGFVIFSHETIEGMNLYLKGLVGLNNNPLVASDFVWFVSENLVVLITCIVFSLPLKELFPNLYGKISDRLYFIKPIVIVLLFVLSVAYIVNDSYNPFLYFRF